MYTVHNKLIFRSLSFLASIDFVRFYLFAFHTFSFDIIYNLRIIIIFMQLLTINVTPATMTPNVDWLSRQWCCVHLFCELIETDHCCYCCCNEKWRMAKHFQSIQWTKRFNLQLIIYCELCKLCVWYKRTLYIPFFYSIATEDVMPRNIKIQSNVFLFHAVNSCAMNTKFSLTKRRQWLSFPDYCFTIANVCAY